MASKTASRSGQRKSSSRNGASKSKAKSAASTRSRAKATQSNGGSAKRTTAKASGSNGGSAKRTAAKASRSNGGSAKRTTAKVSRSNGAKSQDTGLVETVKDTASKASGPVKDVARKAKGPAVAVGAAAGVAGGVLLANRMKRKTVLGVKVPRSISKELSNLDVKSVAKSIGKASEQFAKTSKTVSGDIERAGDQAERIGKILG